VAEHRKINDCAVANSETLLAVATVTASSNCMAYMLAEDLTANLNRLYLEV
jgi:hypothetical protein